MANTTYLSGKKNEIADVEQAIGLGLNTLLTGPTGCGKTRMAQEVADKLGKNLYVIQGSDGAAYEHIIGYRDVVNDGGTPVTKWVDGILIRAMRDPKGLLYWDEPNATPDGIRFLAFSAMDHRREVTLAENGGETVRASSDFAVIAAMNEGGGYGGTSQLSYAFRDRFDVIVDMDYLSEADEKKLVSNTTGISAADADNVVRLATTVRRGSESSKVKTPVSTRSLLSWGRLVQAGVGQSKAAELVLINKAPSTKPQERKVLRDAVEAHFGSGVVAD